MLEDERAEARELVLQEGHQKGLEQGLQQGKINSQKEIALNLKK